MRIMSQDRKLLIEAQKVTCNFEGKVFAVSSFGQYDEIGKYSNWNKAEKVILDMSHFFCSEPERVYYMPYRCDIDYKEEL